jgi:hypothetical protein
MRAEQIIEKDKMLHIPGHHKPQTGDVKNMLAAYRKHW